MLIVIGGISAIGKSKFVKNNFTNGEVIVEVSKIREELTGDPLNQSMNMKAFEIAMQRIEDNLKEGKTVVYDATNLTKKHRARAINIAKLLCVTCQIYFFYVTDYNYLYMSNKWRAFPIPEQVLDRQIAMQEMPSNTEADVVIRRNMYNEGEMVFPFI